MHELTKKDYDSFKAICKKEGIKYKTELEYEEAARNLFSLYDMVFKLAVEQHGWEKRLKEEPQGFWLDSEGRTCYVCSTNVHGQIWFDKWGLKCDNCQAAFNKKVFPGYILKDRDNNKHITDSQLKWRFGLHSQTIKKLVRLGKLKPRVIPGGPMIFLKKENPEIATTINEVRSAKR